MGKSNDIEYYSAVSLTPFFQPVLTLFVYLFPHPPISNMSQLAASLPNHEVAFKSTVVELSCFVSLPYPLLWLLNISFSVSSRGRGGREAHNPWLVFPSIPCPRSQLEGCEETTSLTPQKNQFSLVHNRVWRKLSGLLLPNIYGGAGRSHLPARLFMTNLTCLFPTNKFFELPKI